ncbi:MAG TPA: hypothetical protein ENJ40_03885 [Thermosulfurimonas dismutans]|uniref:Lipopolysaccharide heptosyltransferase family protein n=1 Tax=Thermosulfurimonas dismutans TaxID=999894 RepID=A0A7C3H0P3_9BACT|nr:hypothetical protein [Thermosulfurimonas dismutans]
MRTLLWHEGALGDLLLSRLAIGALAGEESSLAARSEARKLFAETGLVARAFSTEVPPPRNLYSGVTVFARDPALAEVVARLLAPASLRIISTLPRKRAHLALYQWIQAGGDPRAFAKARLLRPRGFTLKPRYLLVHPGSGGRWKCYPPSALRESLRRLSGAEIRILLGPAEEDLAPEFRAFPVTQSRSLEEALEVLSGAMALVGNDSGLTHLAAALGLPVLALFGPTDPVLWAPFGERVRVLYPWSGLVPRELTRHIQEFLNTTARSDLPRRRKPPPRQAAPREDGPNTEAEPWEAEAGPWEAAERPRKTGMKPRRNHRSPKGRIPLGKASLALLGVEVVEVGEAPR